MKPLHRNSVFWLTLVVGSLLLLGGCGSSPTIGNGTTSTPPTVRYKIAPGDSLQIFVRDNPKLSITVPVRPDGRISTPLVQSIMAAGKTPDQLASDLEKALTKYIRSPMVTVIVESFVGSFNQQVRVVGQAGTPKAVPYRRGMTLLDVMIQVGGLTKFAAGNDAKIVRHLPDGKTKTIPVHLGDLMDGDIEDNRMMYPGDILIIPQSML
ncbi:MAG TPA: XrtA/PEP-CTERM system exopolysaccharide export protein [Oleiagrimonas sp.]|nr:XrtA/PEP-CTERM system exopolysaccharide export protein [Oleiagrimonas sp.]